MFEELYQELLLDAAKHPKRRGTAEGATHSMTVHNPLCGDKLTYTAIVADGKIQKIKFEGNGCFISQAAASLLADLAEGLSVEELREKVRRFREAMYGKDETSETIGDLVALEGVKKFPIRIKCALLAFETVEKMLREGGINSAPAS